MSKVRGWRDNGNKHTFGFQADAGSSRIKEHLRRFNRNCRGCCGGISGRRSGAFVAASSIDRVPFLVASQRRSDDGLVREEKVSQRMTRLTRPPAPLRE